MQILKDKILKSSGLIPGLFYLGGCKLILIQILINRMNQIFENEAIHLIEYASNEYDEVIKLRYEILRKPLNLHFTSEQLTAEKDYFHLGYFKEDKLIACLMLVPEENGKMKMKQVAVEIESQGKGIGAKLVSAAEKFASEKGFSIMYCHARDTAVPFYEKLNYKRVGEMFEEVSIPHWEMEKEI
jgi:predicted GNAT family N-acyltransferase